MASWDVKKMRMTLNILIGVKMAPRLLKTLLLLFFSRFFELFSYE